MTATKTKTPKTSDVVTKYGTIDEALTALHNVGPEFLAAEATEAAALAAVQSATDAAMTVRYRTAHVLTAARATDGWVGGQRSLADAIGSTQSTVRRLMAAYADAKGSEAKFGAAFTKVIAATKTPKTKTPKTPKDADTDTDAPTVPTMAEAIASLTAAAADVLAAWGEHGLTDADAEAISAILADVAAAAAAA